MKRTALLVLAGACLAFASCSSTDPTQTLTPNATGTWDATVTVTGGTEGVPGTVFDAALVLVQAGSDVNGTFSTSTSDGTVVGTVSGRTLTFTINQVNPCAETFNGTAKIAPLNEEMTGSYSGTDCSGTVEAAFLSTRSESAAHSSTRNR